MKNYIGPKSSLKNSAKNKQKLEKLLNKKSLPTLKKELQEVFNLFIRLRDTRHDKGQAYFICISCNQPKPLDQMNAGHFHPVGGNEAVRYDEDNTHGQCIYCNNFKHGNLREYERNLVNKIGTSKFHALEIRRHNRSKMMAFEIEYLIQHYSEKVAVLRAANKSVAKPDTFIEPHKI